ncbi:hypothetical protein NTHI1209_01757 [Haemophilus influenzae]|uniref:Uncharacterized protein n=1 Tax=Haemophilus influenzae TaxID=727 RepID=A0A158SZ23_HAEIF|nr:hypothetical protein NTHI1209_01757 [Haemophilus influenzae]
MQFKILFLPKHLCVNDKFNKGRNSNLFLGKK